jgi:sulfofructose kinase
MPLVVCLGMAVLDRIFTVPALPTGPTKLYSAAVQEVGGGPASTAAAAVCRLGGQARLFGRVGADTVGDAVLAGLARDGVDAAGVLRVAGASSAWSAVAVDPDGERLILNTPGRGLDISPDWIDAGSLAGAGAVLVDMGWPGGAALLLRLARQAGVPSVLDADLGPHPGAAALIPLASHVVFSAAGLAHHAGTPDPADGLRRMREAAPGATLGVTLGGDGCLWLLEDMAWHSPAPRVPVRDTLGAGDVFHGAYALALAERQPVRQAARFANAAAALKCTRSGGRAGIPDRAEVEALLSSG